MMIPSKVLRFLILVPIFLGGCVWIEDVSDLRSFVAQEKQKKVAKVEPLPEFKPYHSFVYEGASMRSPFKPLISIITIDTEEGATAGADSGIKPDIDRERTYLETFSLDNLSMVGSINMSANGSRWALIKDKKGEVHRISVGDYMGLDYGKVVAVNSDNVELIEIVTNGRGGWMRRPRSVVMD
ncbi:pilus assembly protein PilP [Amphritea sp. 1_MG-2023]|uniref:pilus assembly protein PilP n=1 Tax=Amphritea sp. 1_MG-2023 TaxID=3062670 RepID=UPI0026E1A06A|nr:pilus assembly protein PilP [Amphritea sp. 1_MG-2023]MDO6563038.1 pilus assembly protein PilP [Amphritea sp. 1_MG-2023]